MSTWILLSLLSGLLLGCYDVAKKASVKDNAVPPVLLLSVLTGAVIWLVILVLARTTDSPIADRDRWVAVMLVATLLGSLCAIYDKYLLQIERIPPVSVQAWFSIYLVPVILPMAIRWWRRDRQQTPFQWRWSIPLIAVLLLVADYAYFEAVADPDALISVISPLRRTSVVVAFAFGILSLKERNWRIKAPCIAAILLGVYLLSAGSG